MNRALLIAVCDFLVLSILSLGVFEQELKGQKGNVPTGKTGPSVVSDIYKSLETLIEDEQLQKKQLKSKLDKTIAKSQKQQQDIANLKGNLQNVETSKKNQKRELDKRQKELDKTLKKLALVKKSTEQFKNQLAQNLKLKSNLEKELKKSEKNLAQKEKTLTQKIKAKEKESKLAQLRLDQALNSMSTLTGEVSKAQKRTAKLENILTQKEKDLAENVKKMTNLLEQAQKNQAKSLESELRSKKLAEKISQQQKSLASMQHQFSRIERSGALAAQESKILRKKIEESIANEKASLRIAKQIEKKGSELVKENKKLAESVVKIASKSMEVHEKIEATQPLSTHTLFNDYINKKLSVHFEAMEKRLLNKNYYDEVRTTIAVSDKEGNLYCIFLAEQTPLGWQNFGGEMLRYSRASLKSGDKNLAMSDFYSLKQDPRIAVMDCPKTIIGAEQAYPLANNPLLFEDAILIDPSRGYYSRCDLKVTEDDPNYLVVPTSFSTRVFGKFSPKAGNIVLSRRGHFLGMMVDDDKCLYLTKIVKAEKFLFGNTLNKAMHLKAYESWKARMN